MSEDLGLRRGTARRVMDVLAEDPAGQYDPHVQLIVRTWDHLSRPLPGCAVHLNSFGGNAPARLLINDLFEDVHVNIQTPHVTTCPLRAPRFDARTVRWKPALPLVNGVSLEIDVPLGPGGHVLVVPLRLSLDSATLQRWLEPHRTTLLDVQLLRLPSMDTLRMG